MFFLAYTIFLGP